MSAGHLSGKLTTAREGPERGRWKKRTLSTSHKDIGTVDPGDGINPDNTRTSILVVLAILWQHSCPGDADGGKCQSDGGKCGLLLPQYSPCACLTSE
nr:hypothetical protein J6590_020936 [Homalodisca vitripennis]